LLALPALYLLARLVPLADPENVPRAALVLLVLQLATLPAANAISRRYEREADWIAFTKTRDPAAARGLFQRFATTSLDDPEPPWWDRVLLEDHPSLLERIELATSLRRRFPGGS
jgi:STE24 endopeptidase